MANELPDTIIAVPIEKGVRDGFLVPVRKGVFKLVGAAGKRGLERE
jgi:hypothetical protein